MGSDLAYRWKTAEWEAGGLTLGFFGVSSLIIFLFEPVFSDQPYNVWLLVFGTVCLIFSWLALEEALRRSVGR